MVGVRGAGLQDGKHFSSFWVKNTPQRLAERCGKTKKNPQKHVDLNSALAAVADLGPLGAPGEVIIFAVGFGVTRPALSGILLMSAS